MASLQEYLRENRQAFLEKWFEALRIPSVSAESEHKPDIRRMADWLAGTLGGIGLDRKSVV